jgi:transcriptional regulator with XRE-family HTH domain
MKYTQLFRSLREARALTIEELAAKARCHRNTVVNVEAGRPVKFKTIALLMNRMGYAADSPELKSIALLWLEAVSDIPFAQAATVQAARQGIQSYRASARQAAQHLEATVLAQSLTVDQINLLAFAAKHPEVCTIISQVRDLILQIGLTPEEPLLHVADEPSTDD